jgi:GNAT superfamily N-acetyltransferase
MADWGKLKLAAAPTPLTPDHDLSSFSSGVPALDDWLRRRALANQYSGASRTFVAEDAARQVIGFYSLAAGAVTHALGTGAVRRNMPKPIPVIVLGRLAVAMNYQGRGVGAALLQGGVERCRRVAEHAGVRAMLVHALDDRAASFYERYGFAPSPVQARTLMLAMRRN